jgi:hypothetical protein
MATTAPTPPAIFGTDEAKRRRRWFTRWLLVAALALGGGGYGIYLFSEYLAEAHLAAAIAEADRLDPGWRAEELLAARDQPPDADNAAVTVVRIIRSLPPRWHQLWMDQPFDGPGYHPRHRMRDDDYQALKLQLNQVAAHIEAARTLAAKRRGYIPVDWKIDCFSILLPHTQESRTIATLLGYDIQLRLHEGQADDALKSVQAIIGGGTSIADEPTLISSLVRIAINAIAIDRLQRCLALSEPSPPALVEIQKRVEEEEATNYILPGLRGERAFIHRWLQHVRKDPKMRDNFYKMMTGSGRMGGIFGTGPGTPQLSTGVTAFDDFVNRLGVRFLLRSWPEEIRQVLEVSTKMVEAAKMPDDQRPEALRDLRDQVQSGTLLVRMLLPAHDKMVEAQNKVKTAQRAAITALAAERFRRDHGRWPTQAEELVPRYAKRVYQDANTGKPLFWKPETDGLVIYGVGRNGVDNAGDVLPTYPMGTFRAAEDVGFRLWNPEARKQPALPPPPPTEAHRDNGSYQWIAF